MGELGDLVPSLRESSRAEMLGKSPPGMAFLSNSETPCLSCVLNPHFFPGENYSPADDISEANERRPSSWPEMTQAG